MKILYGYPWFASEAYGNVQQMELAYVARLQKAGFEIEGFCLSVRPPSAAMPFSEVDKLWKKKDRGLLLHYDNLLRKLEGFDVLINAAGINLHPEFVETLPIVSVFGCNDDPENSDALSRPVAAAYDICLVGNIAEVESYRQWGAKLAVWHPLGLRQELLPPALTREKILSGERDVDIFMMAERSSPWRRQRFDALEKAFPEGYFFGKGWKRGPLPRGQEFAWLQRTKIGPNIHNSTGPINFRTFYLPANGVLQICDNKKHLGKIYQLDTEVVGFNSIEECIDLCRYYVIHDEERRLIAANGWERAMRDYTEEEVFRRAFQTILPIYKNKLTTPPQASPVIFKSQPERYTAILLNKFSSLPLLKIKHHLKKIFPIAYEYAKKAYRFLNKKDMKNEDALPVGPGGIRIICYEDVDKWILGKFAKKMRDCLIASGRKVNISKFGDPTAAIGHHIIYYNAQKKWACIETFMITHLDTEEKIDKVREQLNIYDMGICMSSETREKLISLGMPAGKLCYVNPAHDGIIKPRPIVLGIASKTHQDGRKNEHALVDALLQLPREAFILKIMGVGWEKQVEALCQADFTVEYYPKFDYNNYTRSFIPSLDYFLYFSSDEGSMAFLDALAADVKTIVTAQGYHLDVPNGIDHVIKEPCEIVPILLGIYEEREKRLQRISGWTWEEYTWRHEVIWDYLLTRQDAAFTEEWVQFVKTAFKDDKGAFPIGTASPASLLDYHNQAVRLGYNAVAKQLLRQCLVYNPDNTKSRELLRACQ